MDVKTFRANSMQQALRMVRDELGPEAAVLHTRQLGGGVLRWLTGRRIEVTASASVQVPSRLPEEVSGIDLARDFSDRDASHGSAAGADDHGVYDDKGVYAAPQTFDYRAKFRDDLQGQIADLHSMVEDLCRRHASSHERDMPEALFELFTDLIDAELSEELARDLVDRLRRGAADLEDPVLLKARAARMIEDEMHVCGAIPITPGHCRTVALVGPTGVGKTTTIAKLAANFRLREKRRVGLITVDTYRIAAVEQLRTYADIIDLPMEVVSTPREMRQAVARLSDMELILMDTAGRSPRDEVKIQELKSMLTEAQPDEVHLVLSSSAASSQLVKTAERFAEVGTTALLLTKLDETTGLGNVLPLLRTSGLPLSYVTNGQNVPDDIQAADAKQLAQTVLGLETARR